MGIAMPFSRVSGPGDLRTRRRGSRIDDGIPGRERHRGYDARRRSRDVGELQQKSGTAVYRNEEIVFLFVLWQLGDRYMEKKQIIKQAINSLISGAYFLLMIAITVPIWHFWLVGPWLSILGLTDQIENHSFLVESLIKMVPAIPLWILAVVIHEKVMTKFFRDVEYQLEDGYMKKETKNSLIYKVIIFVIWSTTVTIVMYLWSWWSESLLSIFGLTDHALYLLIFAAPFLLLGSAVHKYVKKIYRDEE